MTTGTSESTGSAPPCHLSTRRNAKQCLIEEHEWVERRVRRQLSRRHAGPAADIAQEVRARVLRASPTFQHIAEFRAYIAVALRSVLASQSCRRRSRLSLLSDDSLAQIPAPAPEPHLQARLSILDDCIKRLTEEERQVLQLRFWDGLTTRQIAQRLGEKRDAVRMRAYRAQARLRDLMVEYESCRAA